MRYLLPALVTVTSLSFGFEKTPIRITSDFTHVENLMKNYHKNVLIIFLGGAFLDESQAILQKVKSKEFERIVGASFAVYFADLNFPLFTPEEIKCYEELLQKFSINSFPSMILCNAKYEEISRFESSNLSAESLANQVLKANFSYEWICSRIENGKRNELRELYYQAADLGCESLQSSILDVAFQSKEIDADLKIEKYLSIVKKGLSSSALLQYKKEYLVEEFLKDNNFLKRVSLIDFQFSLPMDEIEKKQVEGVFKKS
jgi:hypothetical protein